MNLRCLPITPFVLSSHPRLGWEYFHWAVSTQGEGTSELHLCSQRSLLLIIKKALWWRKGDFTYQVCFLISADDWKKDEKRDANCSDNILLILFINHCFFFGQLVILYRRTMWKPKHPGYECLLASLRSKLFTLPLSVVSSSGTVWSRLSYFPASDIKLSLTLQMVQSGFNKTFCPFFSTVFLSSSFLSAALCDACMNAGILSSLPRGQLISLRRHIQGGKI